MTDNESTTRLPSQPSSSTAGIMLHGRWLTLARAAWGTLLIITLGLSAIAVPLRFTQLTQTASTHRGQHQLTPEEAQILTQAGLSTSLYALYTTAFQAVLTFVYLIIGLLIFCPPSIPFISIFASTPFLLFLPLH